MSEPKRIEVYAVGLVSASACAANDVPREEVLAHANNEFPTGVAPWLFSKAPTFKGGESNPCPCSAHPGTHTHYLLEC